MNCSFSVRILRGGTRAAFPAEPTPLRVRAGSAGQCRAVGRLEEVALTGAWSGALGLTCSGAQVRTGKRRLVSCGENRTPGAVLRHVVCVRCSRPRFVGGSAWRDRPAQPADPVPPARAPQSPDEERSGRQLCQMHNCEMLFIGKVAARGRAARPTKRGRNVRNKENLLVR